MEEEEEEEESLSSSSPVLCGAAYENSQREDMNVLL